MTERLGWQEAFLAFGALLGEPREACAAALGEDGDSGRAVQSPQRDVRARAVARVAAEVVAELEGASLQ
jgi:hypothetical protein